MIHGKLGTLISRRQFMRLAVGGVAGMGAVSWHSLLFSPTNPVVSREVFSLKNLPDSFSGLRIAQLSDLHFSPLVSRAYLEKCVEITNALEPDLIFLTGDFVTREPFVDRDVTRRDYIEPLEEILKPLRARAGKFAVLGNHDVAVNPRAIVEMLNRADVHVLRDEAMALTDQGRRLPVVGLSDYGTEIIDQERAFSGIDPDEPALILMHHPDLFGVGMDHRNGLIFAGHTHGGQINIPFMAPVYVPSQFGARFLSGRFQNGGLQMFVNRGLGVIHYRVRFNCRPEITLATLES